MCRSSSIEPLQPFGLEDRPPIRIVLKALQSYSMTGVRLVNKLNRVQFESRGFEELGWAGVVPI